MAPQDNGRLVLVKLVQALFFRECWSLETAKGQYYGDAFASALLILINCIVMTNFMQFMWRKGTGMTRREQLKDKNLARFFYFPTRCFHFFRPF